MSRSCSRGCIRIFFQSEKQNTIADTISLFIVNRSSLSSSNWHHLPMSRSCLDPPSQVEDASQFLPQFGQTAKAHERHKHNHMISGVKENFPQVICCIESEQASHSKTEERKIDGEVQCRNAQQLNGHFAVFLPSNRLSESKLMAKNAKQERNIEDDDE